MSDQSRDDLDFSVVPQDDKKTRSIVTAQRHLSYIDRAKFPLAKPKDIVLAELSVDNDPPNSQLLVGRRGEQVQVSARITLCENPAQFFQEMGVQPEEEAELSWRNSFPIISLGRAVNNSPTPAAYLALRYYVLRFIWASYLENRVIHAQVAKNFQGQSFLKHLTKYGYQTALWPGKGMYGGTEDDRYFLSFIWIEALPYALHEIESESKNGLSPGPGKKATSEPPKPFSLGSWTGPAPFSLSAEGPPPKRDWNIDFDKIGNDADHKKVIEARLAVGHALELLKPKGAGA